MLTLSEGPHSKRNPSPDVKERIARVLGLLPGELDDTLSLQEYLIDALHGYPRAALMELRTTAERFRVTLELMGQDPRWSSRERAAEALGVPLETITAIMAGTEPDMSVVRQLSQSTGLSIRWWIRGRLDPHPAMINRILEHEDAAGYLEAIDVAIEANIPSKTLKGIVAAISGLNAKGEAD